MTGCLEARDYCPINDVGNEPLKAVANLKGQVARKPQGLRPWKEIGAKTISLAT
jgi:hypothetical protein